jgi:hypothetical protein
MTRELVTDLIYLLVFVALGALAGWFSGRWYERRSAPQANVYINRFDCTEQGVEEARRLQERVLQRQPEAGK